MASERQIRVGDVPIGGGAPVAVQTMTKTETADLRATMEQIRTVAETGADIVRVAVPRDQDVEALKTIVRESPIPVIADIHFNYTLALKALDAGAHCVRLNPGNIGGPDKVAQVAKRASELGTPLRIGVNSGSLPAHLRELEERFRIKITVTADPSMAGQQPFAIERGEQIHSIEQARAIANQPSAIVAAIEYEDTDLETAETEEFADDEQPADEIEREAERQEGVEGPGRRRRRRLRRGRHSEGRESARTGQEAPP